jgi:hypothetical protein
LPAERCCWKKSFEFVFKPRQLDRIDGILDGLDPAEISAEQAVDFDDLRARLVPSRECIGVKCVKHDRQRSIFPLKARHCGPFFLHRIRTASGPE